MMMLNLILASVFLAVVNCKLTGVPGEKWNYVTVRKDAHMFWWLYESGPQYLQKPLVIWLQGGPGGSGVGFGNFGEMGPLDNYLRPRNTTWLQKANLLFVDNPVGTGYSYVTNPAAYTRNVAQIADDLLALMKAFLSDVPEFQKVPVYIFSESYGGKMAIAFAEVLHESIRKREVNCLLKGVALGDSWISPTDSVDTWGEYLFAMSVVDEVGRDKIDVVAKQAKQALENKDYVLSERYWSQAEYIVETVSGGVNFYNIQNWWPRRHSRDLHLVPRYGPQSKERHFKRHVENLQSGSITDLMNNEIRRKLKIIPDSVRFGSQSGNVFEKQYGDFMVPVVDIVDRVLALKDLHVIVYNGQMDLIVDTIGTERWVQKLTWPQLECYNKAPRRAVLDSTRRVMGYTKKFEQFSFFWILNAGHMVPLDAGEASLKMLDMVFEY